MKARRNKLFVAADIALSVVMLGAGAYAAIGSTAGVDNEISVGAVNIALSHSYDDNGTKTQGIYSDEGVASGADVSSVPHITNLGISSYIRLAVNYYDKTGASVERAAVNELARGWTKVGDYYYLTREASPGEEFDVFKSITIPRSWEIEENRVSMTMRADAIQAANFTPDFTSDAPWGAVAIEEFDDANYQIDSESRASTVTVTYGGVSEQYISVPESFLAQLNMLTPGDEVDSEIAINNSSNEEHEMWVSADVADAGLSSALRLRLEKAGTVLYEGSLADLGELSLGKYNAGDTSAISVKLSLPADAGNDIAGVASSINWKFRVDAEEAPIPVGPQTSDNIMTSLIIFLASLAGLIIVSLFERRQENE